MDLSRRRLLKLGGAALGTAALGPRALATPSEDRFILDVGDEVSERDVVTAQRAGLEVVHDLERIGYLAVKGRSADVGKVPYDGFRDLDIDRMEPAASLDGVDPESVTPAEEVDAEPNHATLPAYWSYQWDKQRMNVVDAQHEADGSGTRIAVIDSGVHADHPDNDVNAALSVNFTTDGKGAANNQGGYHGSHVAGIAAGNGAGMMGIAPAAEVVDCRVFSRFGGGSFSAILAAILYSGSIGSDVANMSLGALYPASSVSDALVDSLQSATGAAIDTVTEEDGTVVVVAAGNDGQNIDGRTLSVPSEMGNVINVSATGPTGFMDGTPGLEQDFTGASSYTNFGGRSIDLGAPGGNGGAAIVNPSPDPGVPDSVFSTFTFPPWFFGTTNPVHTYGWIPGTSMASPQVAGAAALVRDEYPSATPQEVYDLLTYTAEGPSAEGFDPNTHGNGFLRPDLAVEADPETVRNSSGRGPSSGRGSRSGRGSSRGGDHSEGTAGSGGSRGRGSNRGSGGSRGKGSGRGEAGSRG